MGSLVPDVARGRCAWLDLLKDGSITAAGRSRSAQPDGRVVRARPGTT